MICSGSARKREKGAENEHCTICLFFLKSLTVFCRILIKIKKGIAFWQIIRYLRKSKGKSPSRSYSERRCSKDFWGIFSFSEGNHETDSF